MIAFLDLAGPQDEVDSSVVVVCLAECSSYFTALRLRWC